MPRRLLLDEMFPGSMAEQLCAKGHDVRAVVASPDSAGLPDEEILIGATEAGRSLVTANIKDFMPLDARYRAADRTHAGLILVSTKAFPQNRTFVPAVLNALSAVLAREGLPGQDIAGQDIAGQDIARLDRLAGGQVLFLARQ